MASNKRLIAAGALGGVADVIDIDNFSFTSSPTDEFNPSDIGIYTGGGVQFGDNGSKIYCGSEFQPSGIIYQYNTPSAFNLPADSATSTKNKDLDGAYVYLIQFVSSTVFFAQEYYTASDRRYSQYTLSTAWDISTATVSSSNKFSRDTMSNKLSGWTAFAGITFNSDGSSLYQVFGKDSGNGFRILRFDLSTAYDISGIDSASADSDSGDLGSIPGGDSIRGAWITESEAQIIFAAQGYVYQIDMTTPSDLTTASITKNANTGYAGGQNFHYYPDAQKCLMSIDGGSKYLTYDYTP